MKFSLSHRFSPKLLHRALYESLSQTPKILARPVEWSWTWPDSLDDVDGALKGMLDEVATIAAGQFGIPIAFLGINGGVCLAVDQNGSHSTDPGYLKCIALRSPEAEVATSIAIAPVRLGSLVLVGYRSGKLVFFDSKGSIRGITQPVNAEVISIKYESGGAVDAVSGDEGYSGFYVAFADERNYVGRITPEAIEQICIDSSKFGYKPDGRGWLLWDVPAQQTVSDFALAGEKPPSITEECSDGALRLLSVGVSPAITAISCNEDSTNVASALAMQAVGALFGAAKDLLYSKNNSVEPALVRTVHQPKVGTTSVALEWDDDSTSQIYFETPQVAAEKSITGLNVRGNARKSVKAASTAIRARVSRRSAAAESDGFTSTKVGHISRENTTNEDQQQGSLGANTQSRSLRSAPLGKTEENKKTGIREVLSEDSSTGFPNRKTIYGKRGTTESHPARRVLLNIATAPLSSTIFAVADNIGRVALHDSRDLCMIELYKGHRDARLKWVMHDSEALLAIFSPSVANISLYSPLRHPRFHQELLESFKVPQNSHIATQSVGHSLILVAPSGLVYRLKRTEEKEGKLQEALDRKNRKRDHTDLRVTTFLDYCSQNKIDAVCAMINEMKPSQNAYLLSRLIMNSEAEVSAECHCAAAQTACLKASSPLKSRFNAHFKLATVVSMLKKTARSNNNHVLHTEGSLLKLAIPDLAQIEKFYGKTEEAPTIRSLLTINQFILGHELQLDGNVESIENSYVLTIRHDTSYYFDLLRMYFEMPRSFEESINVVMRGTLELTRTEIASALGNYIMILPANDLGSVLESELVCEYLTLWNILELYDSVSQSHRVVNGMALVKTRLRFAGNSNASDESSDAKLHDLSTKLNICLQCYRIFINHNVNCRSCVLLTPQQVSVKPFSSEAIAIYAILGKYERFDVARTILKGCESVSTNKSDMHFIAEHVLDASRLLLQQVFRLNGKKATLSSEVRAWILQAVPRYRLQPASEVRMDNQTARLGESLCNIMHLVMPYFDDTSVECVRCLQVIGVASKLVEVCLSP